jgi:uridine kinase
MPGVRQDSLKIWQNLKEVNPLFRSRTARDLSPTPYIVVEAPLGYEHLDTGKHIDFMVFIDTPLDVAMARRILRDYFGEHLTLSDEQAKVLKIEMESYLKFSRAAYLNMDKTVKLSADMGVDGTLPLDDLAAQILARLESKK